MTLLDEIRAERERQDAKWGGSDHDDTHSERDWCDFVEEHSQKARLNQWRQRMIEVAALAVAAVESIDRRNGIS